jgi:hypothetical protein
MYDHDIYVSMCFYYNKIVKKRVVFRCFMERVKLVERELNFQAKYYKLNT